MFNKMTIEFVSERIVKIGQHLAFGKDVSKSV